eukprot:4815085-Prymnesium_polylepis.1
MAARRGARARARGAREEMRRGVEYRGEHYRPVLKTCVLVFKNGFEAANSFRLRRGPPAAPGGGLFP